MPQGVQHSSSGVETALGVLKHSQGDSVSARVEKPPVRRMEQTWFIKPVDSYLDRFPLVDLGARGGRGTQQPLFLHSGQGVLDPPEDLPKRMTLVTLINIYLHCKIPHKCFL